MRDRRFSKYISPFWGKDTSEQEFLIILCLGFCSKATLKQAWIWSQRWETTFFSKTGIVMLFCKLKFTQNFILPEIAYLRRWWKKWEICEAPKKILVSGYTKTHICLCKKQNMQNFEAYFPGKIHFFSPAKAWFPHTKTPF